MSRVHPIRTLVVMLVGLTLSLHPAAAEAAKLILALGDDSYIPSDVVQGAEVKKELGEYELVEFAVVILSNVSYGGLPSAVQRGLSEYLGRGGSLLITGGPNAYGSGGYQAIADVLPFEVRAEQDWTARPFKPVIPLQPGHPILEGVTFRTVGNFNDLNPKPGAVEIAQYAGGGLGRGVGGGPGGLIGGTFQSPMIAEQRVGQGTVLGVAFDLGQEVRSGWPDGTRFVRNLLNYLAALSPLEPKPREKERGGGERGR
ncbi:MAG: hypothetical protein L0Y78_03670 [candidate division NC10 bacterium]|nr:hypothetical protein [candidate division NC10 bacterium]